MKEMITYKIPASIILAQGLLESGSGNSRLAQNGNNHFGIKCKKDWTGCTILEDDDALQECFRCYTSAEESYKDHSRFLRDNKRYAALFELSYTDYRGWASGLLAAGYATNQKYTDLLVNCIERNKLAHFDTLVINGYNPFEGVMPANMEVVNTKNIPLTVIQPNQTLHTVAEQHDKSEKKLAKYNDLNYHRIQPGDVIYLKPKKRKAGVATHTVLEGEDMWLISQKYAIKIQSLYKKNMMDKGTEPLPGSVLHLQHKTQAMPDTISKAKQLTPAAKKTNTENTNTRKSELSDANVHIVQAGETLYSISKRYNMPMDEIKTLNHLSNDNLYLGQQLKIAKNPADTGNKVSVRSYIVKSGDTLYSISKLFQVSIEDIKKWNNLDSNSLTVGQIIVIH